jgi:peptidoglycan hydrolase-like protein with peptidoglycan-binding domain
MNMKSTRSFSKFLSFVLVLSFFALQAAPVLALGEVTVETNVPPAPSTPEPAPAPVSTPAPEPTPTPTVSTPSVTETAPTQTTTVTEPVVNTITAGDTTAPDITSVLAISVLPTEENIAWTTNELATSHLEYGTTQSYGSTITLSATAGLAHLAVLTGLTLSTRYYYCIHSTDLASNTANSCGHEFTTEAQSGGSGSGTISNNNGIILDTTPPDISLVTVTSVNTNSAAITWTTDDVANAEVEYGTTSGYGSVSPLDTNLALTHSVTLTGLTPNTDYHYRIRSADELGNTAVGPDNLFTTSSLNGSGEVATTVPEVNITNNIPQTNTSANVTLVMHGVEASSVSDSSVTIVWTTDLPSDSQIEYGESQDLGSITTLNTSLVTSHSVVISNLSPNTNYIFRVKSKPVGASVATLSGFHDFTTLSHSTPVIAPANVSSVASSNVTSSSANITWSTDKGATSQVEFGLSTSYSEFSSLNSSFSTSHSIALSSLDALTTYHYRVKSIDDAGNVTFSNDHTFTTLGLSQNLLQSTVNNTPQIILPPNAPDAINTLSIGGYDQSSAALVWNTTTASSDVSHEYDIRYSTSPITESNYTNATEAQLTPIYHGDLDPEGTAREYIVAGLNTDTTYYFAIKAKHQLSDWSSISNIVSAKTTVGTSVNNESQNLSGQTSPINAEQTILSGGGVLSVVNSGYGGGSGGSSSSSFEPTVIKTEPADSQIVFQWNNPGEANFVRTVVVRKEGSYPNSPTDGQTIYEGRGQTFTDTNVVNGKTYYYALYSYNHSKVYSTPVLISLAPKAGNTQLKFNESGSLGSATPIEHFTKVYQKGDKNVEIEHLQEILLSENVSFPQDNITGYFGSVTQNSLKLFQKKHGLTETGIVDSATQTKLNAISHNEKHLETTGSLVMLGADIKMGNQSDAVKSLQEFLAHEGSYPEAQITGKFGSLTKKAVMTFQKKYNIVPVSGFVGYKTRHRMQQLMGL